MEENPRYRRRAKETSKQTTFYAEEKPFTQEFIDDYTKNGDVAEERLARKRMPPSTRTCAQAARLEGYAIFCLVFSYVIAIILWIASGFALVQAGYSREMEFHFANMLSITSLTLVISLIVAGHFIKTMLDAFAVIVENSYRNMVNYLNERK